MKKCKKCGSKHLEESGGIFVCVACQEINSPKSLLSALKKLHQAKVKDTAKTTYNARIEELQKTQTKKPYFRFRYFVVEKNNEFLE